MKNKKKASSRKRRKSDFYRERRKGYLINDARAAEFFGVSARTIRNWDQKGAPPMAMRLLHLRYGDLSALHSEWRGFRICDSGILWGPNRNRLPAWAFRQRRELEIEVSEKRRPLGELTAEVARLRRCFEVGALSARPVNASAIWLPPGA